MLRVMGLGRRQAVADVCCRNAARMMSTAPQEATTAPKRSAWRMLGMAVIPIAAIATVLELAYKGDRHGASAASDPNAAPSSSTTSASSSEAGTSTHPGGHGHVTKPGASKGHGVTIDPSNPLHKMLPETDCEFCLDTREKLWGMMKGMKGMKGLQGGGDGTAAADPKAKPRDGGSLSSADAAPNPSLS